MQGSHWLTSQQPLPLAGQGGGELVMTGSAAQRSPQPSRWLAGRSARFYGEKGLQNSPPNVGPGYASGGAAIGYDSAGGSGSNGSGSSGHAGASSTGG